jgi:hypothetical protein
MGLPGKPDGITVRRSKNIFAMVIFASGLMFMFVGAERNMAHPMGSSPSK